MLLLTFIAKSMAPRPRSANGDMGPAVRGSGDGMGATQRVLELEAKPLTAPAIAVNDSRLQRWSAQQPAVVQEATIAAR
jgi:hypothetical protein